MQITKICSKKELKKINNL